MKQKTSNNKTNYRKKCNDGRELKIYIVMTLKKLQFLATRRETIFYELYVGIT